MLWMYLKQASVFQKLKSAVVPVCERLEQRKLLAGTPAPQALPINLNFGAAVVSSLTDKTAQGTGFTYAQPNNVGNEYQASLLQLVPAQKQLKLTTTGTSAAGGPWEADDTLVNGLQDGFNGTSSAFTVSTRLQGPLSYLANPSDQGGILFGPNDDNYVKLVAVSQPTGQVLQFVDEEHVDKTTTYTHNIPVNNSYTNIGSFAAISTLDLQIQADPVTGKITGSYAINGGAMVSLSQSVTLTGSNKSLFFSGDSVAGIMAMAKNDLTPITVTFSSFSIVAAGTTGTGGSSKLSGAVIGTAGSYKNDGDTIAKVFDSNLATYFDGPTASGDWVGLNLGTASAIGQVKFAPRADLPGRMVGGIFQGSSTADFSSGVVNLFTITSTPAAGVLTTQAISDSTKFQYVRYLAPANGYGNIAELEFDGPGTTTSSNKLTGTVTGTAGSYGNSGNTFANVFDSNFNTFFDAPVGTGDYIIDTFSSEALLTQIKYAPRSSYAGRMVGGMFQGSNDPNFASGVANLYTITAAPAAGGFTTVPITSTTAYKYVRYLAPASSYGNVAELEFDGTLTGTQPASGHPSVTSSNPANGATNIDPSGFVSCALSLPNVGAGINPASLGDSTVYLTRTFDGTVIPTEVNTDAAGSVIVLQPQSPLDANTSYTFNITAGVIDTSGATFTPYQISFTTGSQTVPTDPNIAFAKVALPTATGQYFTGVTMGPDGKLYANTETGQIFQYPVNADGTLGTPVIYTLPDSPRLITGIAFDPSSTATSMKIWISSGAPQYSNAADFSGEISAVNVSGTAFSGYQTYITGLPRSNSNHLNDQPVFGPDGALYWCQGSNSSMGAPDSVWGFRPEHLLNAAILRLNLQLIESYVATNKTALNVQTDTLAAGQTAYNPYAANAPLTLYATGVRNAYDLIWDSNGHLYVPTNGSAAGGNIPGTPAGVTPSAPAENNVSQAEDDYLYDVKQGGYYGHPDPARGQYIFGGANPTNPASNQAIQTAYPVGTNPDPNYQGYAFDFGVHYSPDGAIEYSGSAFGGALNGALLITRYSGGKDIEVLRTGSNGQITQSETGITGFTQFNDPVDVIEDPRTGDLYVAELGGLKLTLLRPIASGATLSNSASALYFNAVTKSSASPAQTITITNTGNQPLAIPGTGISLIGSDASLFVIASRPSLPATIAPGSSVGLSIVFNPGSSALGQHVAQLQIASNDPNTPLTLINLRAITTRGLGGSLEPSLQAILNLFQIPDNVGTADPTQTYFNTPPNTPNDEVVMQELVKAGTGNVTVTPLATFSASITPSAGFGYYTAGTPDSRVGLFSIGAADAQSVDPTAIGATSFDPGSGEFGIFASFDAFPTATTGTARIAYSEDLFNTYDTTNHRKVRFYPLKNADGSVVANAYVFATEDFGVAPFYDSNDLVGIIRNVKAAAAGPKIGTQNVQGTNIESAPSPTRLAFNSIANLDAASPNVTHNTSVLRIDNSGSKPLVISSINSSSGAFTITTAVSYPLTIAAGSTLDLTIKYAPTHTGLNAIDSGTLSILSNDPVTPTYSVALAGLWQSYGNMTPAGTYTEPTVPQIVSLFGYSTRILNSGQSIDQNGQIQTVGQEVLSSYWTRADVNLPAAVQQLAAFHTEGNGASLYWYSQGKSTTYNSVLSATGDNAQSLLPLQNDKSQAAAFAMISPTGNFGFNVDKSEYSDNSLNQHGGSLDQGHHMRFWPVYDSAGKLVQNTWLMAMDYTSTGENYDYNDNVYLITNIKPALPAQPTGVVASKAATGVAITWTANAPIDLAGYNIYRGTTASGTFTKLNNALINTLTYADTTAAAGKTWYYQVTAVNLAGLESVPAAVSILA